MQCSSHTISMLTFRPGAPPLPNQQCQSTEKRIKLHISVMIHDKKKTIINPFQVSRDKHLAKITNFFYIYLGHYTQACYQRMPHIPVHNRIWFAASRLCSNALQWNCFPWLQQCTELRDRKSYLRARCTQFDAYFPHHYHSVFWSTATSHPYMLTVSHSASSYDHHSTTVVLLYRVWPSRKHNNPQHLDLLWHCHWQW